MTTLNFKWTILILEGNFGNDQESIFYFLLDIFLRKVKAIFLLKYIYLVTSVMSTVN